MAQYCGQGDVLVHPTAMLVLDKTPPPAPVGLDVTARDPDDPWHFDTLWCEANTSQIDTSKFGARLRWSWPRAAERQAPDLAEFRVYLRKGASNTLTAKVVPTVVAVDPGTRRTSSPLPCNYRRARRLQTLLARLFASKKPRRRSDTHRASRPR